MPTPSGRFALRFPAAREDHPFGPDAHVFKVGDGSTMFAILGDGPPVTVTLKLTKEEREVALELPFVTEARYVGRYGWVTASIEDEPAFDAVCEWMRESYWLKAPKRPARVRLVLASYGSQGSPPVSHPSRQCGESSSATRSRNSRSAVAERGRLVASRCRSRQRRCPRSARARRSPTGSTGSRRGSAGRR